MLYLDPEGSANGSGGEGRSLLRLREGAEIGQTAAVLRSLDIIPRVGSVALTHYSAYPGHFALLAGGDVVFTGSTYDGRLFRYSIGREGSVTRTEVKGYEPEAESILSLAEDDESERVAEFRFARGDGTRGRVALQSESLRLFSRTNGTILHLIRVDHEARRAVLAQEFSADSELLGVRQLEPLTQELRRENRFHEILGFDGEDRLFVLHYVGEIYPELRVFRFR